MDFVDDHGAGRGQHGAARFGTEQDVKRLRGGDDDMRRPSPHLIALGLGGVSGANQRPDFGFRQPLFAQQRADARQRHFQVPLDIVGKGFQRRDIDDLRLVLQFAGKPLPHQIVDGGQKGRERLAGSGGGGDQDIAARLNGRPRFRLCRRGRGKAFGEPGGDSGMEQGIQIHL